MSNIVWPELGQHFGLEVGTQVVFNSFLSNDEVRQIRSLSRHLRPFHEDLISKYYHLLRWEHKVLEIAALDTVQKNGRIPPQGYVFLKRRHGVFPILLLMPKKVQTTKRVLAVFD